MTAWEITPRLRELAMSTPTILPRHTVEQALARLDAGIPTADVSREMGVSQRVLQRWARHARIDTTRADTRDPDRVRQYIDAYLETGSVVLAAERHDVAYNTVWEVLQRHAPDLVQPRPGTTVTATPPARLATAGRPTTRLPVGPLAARLDQAVAAGEEIEAIAHRAQTIPRRVNAIRRHEYPTVTLATADRICVALGIHIHEVYPA